LGQRKKLKYDKPLSSFAFNFNLHRYIKGDGKFFFTQDDTKRWQQDNYEVGRCRLTVSKPVLKAPMVSALETRIS